MSQLLPVSFSVSPSNDVQTAKDHQAFEEFFEVKAFLKDFILSFFSPLWRKVGL